MYTLFKTIGIKKIAATEMPALVASLIIAETFYKFGSFILECGAFLGTWYIVSFLANTIMTKSTKKKPGV